MSEKSLSHAHFFSVSAFRHRSALRTFSALLWFKVGLSKPLHQIKTTSTTCTSCDQLAHTLLCVFDGMNILQSKTVFESNSELDMARRLFQQWIGHRTMKTNSQMVQNDASNNSAYLGFCSNPVAAFLFCVARRRAHFRRHECARDRR